VEGVPGMSSLARPFVKEMLRSPSTKQAKLTLLLTALRERELSQVKVAHREKSVIDHI
jgi:hypothetical protein